VISKGKFNAKIDNAIATAGTVSARAAGDCKFGNKSDAIRGESAVPKARTSNAINDSARKADET